MSGAAWGACDGFVELFFNGFVVERGVFGVNGVFVEKVSFWWGVSNSSAVAGLCTSLDFCLMSLDIGRSGQKILLSSLSVGAEGCGWNLKRMLPCASWYSVHP